MKPTIFVAWLFVMALASVVIAIGDRSWGWLIGGAVLFSVAMFAKRKLREEREDGPKGPRLGFLGLAMLFMLAAVYFLYRLDQA